MGESVPWEFQEICDLILGSEKWNAQGCQATKNAEAECLDSERTEASRTGDGIKYRVKRNHRGQAPNLPYGQHDNSK
jgi:hypothetical protein